MAQKQAQPAKIETVRRKHKRKNIPTRNLREPMSEAELIFTALDAEVLAGIRGLL